LELEFKSEIKKERSVCLSVMFSVDADEEFHLDFTDENNNQGIGNTTSTAKQRTSNSNISSRINQQQHQTHQYSRSCKMNMNATTTTGIGLSTKDVAAVPVSGSCPGSGSGNSNTSPPATKDRWVEGASTGTAAESGSGGGSNIMDDAILDLIGVQKNFSAHQAPAVQPVSSTDTPNSNVSFENDESNHNSWVDVSSSGTPCAHGHVHEHIYGHGHTTTATTTQNTITNAPNFLNMSPKIRMNPRDAASPRRSRKMTAKSKSFRDYEHSIEVSSQSQSQANMLHIPNMSLPQSHSQDTGSMNNTSVSHSLQSWKEDRQGNNIETYTGTTTGAGSRSGGVGVGVGIPGSGTAGAASVKSGGGSSYQNSVVGGLAYVETPYVETPQAKHISLAASASASASSTGHNHHPPSKVRAAGSASASASASAAGSTSASRSHYSVASKGSINSKGSGRGKGRDSSANDNRNTNASISRSRIPQSSSGASTGTGTRSRQSRRRNQGIGKEEQKMFEQRLCDVNFGVAVRKIHSNGKSQLRYVKCTAIDNKKNSHRKGRLSRRRSKLQNMSMSVPPEADGLGSLHEHRQQQHQQKISSSKSVTSLKGRRSRGKKYPGIGIINSNASTSTSVTGSVLPSDDRKQNMALTWGNKKKVVIPLYKFIAVRKGKSTDRTRRNVSHPSQLLSLVTSDKRNSSLDIEAPTKLDRDKFAKAFSIFLDVPLTDDMVGENVDVNIGAQGSASVVSSVQSSRMTMDDNSSFDSSSFVTPRGFDYQIGGDLLPSLTPSPSGSSRDESKLIMERTGLKLDDHPHADALIDSVDSTTGKEEAQSLNELLPPPPVSDGDIIRESTVKKMDMDVTPSEPKEKKSKQDRDGDDKATRAEDEKDEVLSAVSSLTQGFDQEIVEELHQALNELRAELDASRAEAARAVKVAEQAIQSAESCSSNDWNSTVTHKAAEAAAQAQKRSAEAIAKQRAAEQKLAVERKSASFWRKQAQTVEDEASGFQTRLAVAQVQRTAVTEELEREKRKAASYIQTMKRDYSMSESIQRETLVSAAEQNRLLEIELDGTRRDLEAKAEEAKYLQECIVDLKDGTTNVGKTSNKKTFFGKSKKQPRGPSLLLDSQPDSTAQSEDETRFNIGSLHTEELLKIQAESVAMRKQFEILRRTVKDEVGQLPEQAKEWALQASKAINIAQAEVGTLKNQLSLEMANRRKLLHEVQDLRGSVRVYCRPRPMTIAPDSGVTSIISSPSHDVGLLHREIVSDFYDKGIGPLCFEFDHMFAANSSQREVYTEMEELALGTLEGYNACLMTYGQSNSGKTYSMFGNLDLSHGEDSEVLLDLNECGIHFSAIRQLFDVTIDRRERFEDSLTLSILEIHNEKLIDLTAGTNFAENSCFNVRDRILKRKDTFDEESDEGNTKKLEIRTNHDGDTNVQGLASVPIKNYEEAVRLWKESLILRAKRIKDSGRDLRSYEVSSHLIAKIEVMSTNITSGVGTVGKIQFVDLAASNVTPRRSSKSKATGVDNILAPLGNENDWKFTNKSISTFADVVDARVNFSRNVPYRNSSLTHVLRDAIEADTKTVLLACVRSESDNLQDTANSLRFASKIRKVVIGKATKRHIASA